jgi:hypothetical protein
MLDCNRIRILGWIACFLFVLPNCYSQYSLRNDLTQAGIPLTSFSNAELDEAVDGTDASKQPYLYFVYVRRDGDSLTGNPHLVRYDQNTGAVLRSELQVDEKDNSCGSPLLIEFVDEYLLLSFHINPSANSVVVLDQQLKMVELFYGFDMFRVARNQIVTTEDMIHFAPVHPERLEFLDLQTGTTKELFPPKADPLREQFARENGKHEPSDEICRQLENDPCDPELYDEDISILGADGKGQFALVANREASHATKKNEVPVTVASQSALYLYEQGKSGWLYCEKLISKDEANALVNVRENSYDRVKTRCVPNQQVVPDMSTSDFSPFPNPQLRAK